MNAMGMVVTRTLLEELAARANEEHGAAEAAADSWCDHAIAAGEALLQARALNTEPWKYWLARNFAASEWTASLYIRIATHRGIIESRGCSSSKEVKAFMRANLIPRVHAPKDDDPLRPEVRRLRTEGFTYQQIGDLLGISKFIAWGLDNREKKRAKQRRAARAYKLRAAALKVETRRAQAKAIGGGVGKAWNQSVCLASTLDAAIRAESNQETKKVLNAALHSLYRVEDQIVKAIGMSSPHPTS